MHKVELIEVGGEVGFIMPDEIMASLKLKEGDVFHVIERQNSVELTVSAPNEK